MIFGRSAELAIWATLYLARRPPGGLCQIREIAWSTGLPKPYLAKIVQRLTSAGLLRGFRGPGGGVELARDPKSITLCSVVATVEERSQTPVCILGLRRCDETDTCPLHPRWSRVRAEIDRVLQETTLEDLARAPGECSALGPASWARATRSTAAGSKRPTGRKKRRPSRHAVSH